MTGSDTQAQFLSESFHHFGENNYSFYTSARFHVVRVRLKYLMEEEYWPWPIRAWDRAMQWLFDHHPTFCERFLDYLVGGVDEIQATPSAVKPQEGSRGA